jgi:predicted nucleic acid-binding protein
MVEFMNDDRFSMVGSWLLATELRRLAIRSHVAMSEVTDALTRFDIMPILEGDFQNAGILHDPSIRSLDAIHLAVASQAQVDFVVTYDARMKDASLRVFGIPVLEPGVESSPLG